MGLQPSGEQQTKALASALIHILIQVCSMAVFPKFLLIMKVQFRILFRNDYNMGP